MGPATLRGRPPASTEDQTVTTYRHAKTIFIGEAVSNMFR